MCLLRLFKKGGSILVIDIASPLRRVLIAEDDEINQEMMRVMIEKVGWPCLLVDDGEQALYASQQETFAAIFLDWHMPKLGGLEVFPRIKSSPLNRTTPITVVTASATHTEILQIREAGPDHILLKPFRFHELAAILPSKEDNPDS